MYQKNLPKGSIGILLPTASIEKVIGDAFREENNQEPQNPVQPDNPGEGGGTTPGGNDNPQQPENTNPAYAIIFTTNPTQEAVQQAVNTYAQKPTEPIQYDTRQTISTPTEAIVAIPRAWEQMSIIDNGTGWSVAYALNEDNPNYVINGVTYNVYDTTFGVGTYTITFG